MHISSWWPTQSACLEPRKCLHPCLGNTCTFRSIISNEEYFRIFQSTVHHSIDNQKMVLYVLRMSKQKKSQPSWWRCEPLSLMQELNSPSKGNSFFEVFFGISNDRWRTQNLFSIHLQNKRQHILKACGLLLTIHNLAMLERLQPNFQSSKD